MKGVLAGGGMALLAARYGIVSGNGIWYRRNNEVSASRGEGVDPHAPVFGALDPVVEAFRHETAHGNADRTWGEKRDA
jgi:hypothetical protein